MKNTDLQQRAFNKLNRLKVGALFMEMGTGKTKVALDLLAFKQRKCDLMIWVCPCSLKGEIRNELKKWQPNLNIKIIGCESIGCSDTIFVNLLEEVSSSKCTFIVVDESLKIKNLNAKRTQRILELSKLANYKLILNGSPISKNVLDLYTQLNFLSPKILNESYTEFKDKYCEYFLRGPRKGKVKKQVNIPNLISRIKPYIYDAKLELDVSKFEHDVTWAMDKQEQDEYATIKYEMLASFIDNTDISFFALSSKLQNYYATCDSKQESLQNLIEKIDGKIVVFVKFLGSIPDNSLEIIGDMDTTERMQAIEQFKNTDSKVLYITYGCGAYGLNLQFASNMIFADGTFNYAETIQAKARIYRLGQERTVNYYNLICDNSGLEHLIAQSKSRKSNLLDEVKKTIDSLSKEEQIKWLEKHI